MSLTLVPFNAAWISHDKMDLKAIYRRPRFVQDEFGDWQREFKDGLPTWDLTTALPVRSHNRWLAKGFEYVTLATRGALLVAGKFGTLPEGKSVADYDYVPNGGPWNYKKYLRGIEQTATLDSELMRTDVNRFGSDVVTELRRRENPQFELPPELRGVAVGGLDPKPEPKATTKPAKAQEAVA